MCDSQPEMTYSYVVKELEKRKLGFLHLMESPHLPQGVKPLAPEFRKLFSNLLLVNLDYTAETAEAVISRGVADAVTFGTLYISSPDLPSRFARQAPLATPDRATYYGGGIIGYTDYPTL